MLDKKTVYTTFVCLGISCSGSVIAQNKISGSDHNAGHNKSRHKQLKDAIFAEPYDSLPYYKVNKTLFKSKQKGAESRLLSDARRTLSSSQDLFDQQRDQKLLQANGICFSGEWVIDKQSDFSGLFKQSTRVPIIVRASTTFNGTDQNQRRSLGLAVKLLPENLGSSPSLNVFALHSVGGVKTKHLLDLSLDNEPPLGRIPRFQDIPTALKLKSELLKADKEAGSEQPSVTFRSVTPLAEYKEDNVISPRWLRFSAANKSRVDKQDFRDELRVEHYPNKQLIYRIEVAKKNKNKKSNAEWHSIGQLVLDQSITSKVCDTQLHFAHVKN